MSRWNPKWWGRVEIQIVAAELLLVTWVLVLAIANLMCRLAPQNMLVLAIAKLMCRVAPQSVAIGGAFRQNQHWNGQWGHTGIHSELSLSLGLSSSHRLLKDTGVSIVMGSWGIPKKGCFITENPMNMNHLDHLGVYPHDLGNLHIEMSKCPMFFEAISNGEIGICVYTNLAWALGWARHHQKAQKMPRPAAAPFPDSMPVADGRPCDVSCRFHGRPTWGDASQRGTLRGSKIESAWSEKRRTRHVLLFPALALNLACFCQPNILDHWMQKNQVDQLTYLGMFCLSLACLSWLDRCLVWDLRLAVTKCAGKKRCCCCQQSGEWDFSQ